MRFGQLRTSRLVYVINFLQCLANSTTSDLDVHPERPNDYVYYLSGWRADGDSLAREALLFVELDNHN